MAEVDTIHDYADYHMGLRRIQIDGTDYAVAANENEARDAAYEYIEESVWAFNADFIVEHTDLPSDAEEMIMIYQRRKYEDANDVLLALISDLDEFVDDAIANDGLGHFLNSYDGETYSLRDIDQIYWGQVLGVLGLHTKNRDDVLLFRLD